MVGVGTALALQARGFDVVIIDRAGPGNGTSHGNAGFIQAEALAPYALPRDFRTLWRIATRQDNSVDWNLPGLFPLVPSLLSYWRHSAPKPHREASRTYASLVRRAITDHSKWITLSACDHLISRRGYRLVFRNPAALEKQLLNAQKLNTSYGVRYHHEDTAALAAAEPALQHTLAGAIHWHDTWTCSDPGALVAAYADLFTRSGGEIVQADVQDLTPTAAGWRIATDDGVFDASDVVVAMGPWSPTAIARLGYRVRMVPKRGYHMHFDYPQRNGNPTQRRLLTPLLDADFGAVYAPMRQGLRICTGADLSAGAPRSMPRQLRRAHAAAHKLLGVGPAAEERAWSGVRPCMPDMLPAVGAAPRHNGLWFNFGHGHQGFTLGPTTGDLLAAIMAGESETVALPLDPSRLPGM